MYGDTRAYEDRPYVTVPIRKSWSGQGCAFGQRKGGFPEKLAVCFLIKVDSRPEKSDSPDANYGRMAMRKTTCVPTHSSF